MSQNEKFKILAADILEAVGGEENVMQVTHCMTRLRFNLKDESVPKDEEIKKISGVIGVVHSGGQVQIIIGQTVEKVYDALIQITSFEATDTISENLDKQKKKMSFKTVGSAILDGLAGSITPLIPVMMAASIFKMLVAVLGPGMLNILSETSDLYILLTFVGDAGFYFFPVIIGYTASKKFGVTPVMGMFLGAIMVHPTLIELATSGQSFTVYGIPINVQNYSNTLFPIIMSVWAMSYVEKFFKKVLPDTLRVIFAPTLTIVVMLPIALGVLGPLGAFLGDYISTGLISFGNVGGFLAVAVIAALWEFLVISGMHMVMISSMIVVFSTVGQDSMISPAATVASLAVAGMCFGAALRMKNKEEKSLAFGYFIASIIGGVTEPGLYGLGMKYKRPFIGLMAGGFVGGLYAGLMNVTSYAMVPVASFLATTGFAGGPSSNFIHGIISCVIGFVVAAVVTYFTGFDSKDQEAKKVLEGASE